MSRIFSEGGCGCGTGGCGGDGKGRETLTSREQLNTGQFSLASLLTSYPTQGLGERALAIVQALEGYAPGGHLLESWQELPKMIASWTSPARLEDLKATYHDLFSHGPRAVSLYEGDYGPSANVTKQNMLADLAGFYKAFGLDMAPSEGEREMGDHLSVELEFYSILLAKEAWFRIGKNEDATHVIRETRRDFLENHLARIVDAIAVADAVAKHAFYGPVFRWCRDLVAREASALGVTIQPLRKETSALVSGDVGCCGSCI